MEIDPLNHGGLIQGYKNNWEDSKGLSNCSEEKQSSGLSMQGRSGPATLHASLSLPKAEWNLSSEGRANDWKQPGCSFRGAWLNKLNKLWHIHSVE